MHITVFLLSTSLVIFLTPLAIVTAKKFGIVDHPNFSLKKHNKSTPYLGGLSILTAVYMTIYLEMFIFGQTINTEHTGLLLGIFIIFSLGLFDDIHSVSPLTKICFQGIAAAIVWFQGLELHLFHNSIGNAIIMFIWVIGISNALNLVDIMDGLASGIGGIAALFFALLMLMEGQLFYGSLLLALSGACLGFLVFNFNPAKIFLGDAGSLTIGFILACSSVKWTQVSEGNQIFVPLILLSIPIFETIYISFLRIRAGRSPLLGSNDHFAKRMVKAGLSIKQTVICTYVLGLLLCFASYLASIFSFYIIYFLTVVIIVFLSIGLTLSKVDIHS